MQLAPNEKTLWADTLGLRASLFFGSSNRVLGLVVLYNVTVLPLFIVHLNFGTQSNFRTKSFRVSSA